MAGPVWFPPGARRGPAAGAGIAAYGETAEVPPEVQAEDERLEASIVRALSKFAGIPVKIQPDGWPTFGCRFRDPRTAIAGVAPTTAYAQLISLTVDQRTNGYIGAIGIGVSDWNERTNLSWRLDLPSRLLSPEWQEINQLQVSGFPLCHQVVHFPLQGGDTFGISVRYTAGAVPAGLVVHARFSGWTWLPRTYDPTNYRGRPE